MCIALIQLLLSPCVRYRLVSLLSIQNGLREHLFSIIHQPHDGSPKLTHSEQLVALEQSSTFNAIT